MASWDFIDEVDILPKLPPNFGELCESKKWQERKEGLETLLKLVTDNERLSTKVSYSEIVAQLQTTLAKDANINVQALAAKCLTRFALGLRAKFAPFATPLLPVIFEKFKEKKPVLREPLVECSNEVARTMPTLEPSQDDILAALGKPNPQIKQQTALFLARQLDLIVPAKQPKALIKAIVPVLGKLTGDADADVRDAAVQALGAVQRLIGDKNVKSLLGDLGADEGRMKKVAEAAENSATNFAEEQSKNAPPPPPPTSASAPSTTAASSGGATTHSTAATTSGGANEADPWDFLDAFDVLAKMPPDFETMMEQKKWTERRDALQALFDLISANPKLEPKANYGALVERLQKVLEKDANINVAALAANCIRLIAEGLRTKFQPFALAVAPIIFEKFKEKKPILRDPLVQCIDSVAATTNLEALGEIVLAALAKPNPSIKTQTDLFLQRTFMKLNSQTMPKKTLKTLVPLLIKHSGDSDSEVRDASYAAMGAMMRAIGEKPSLQLLADVVTDNIKMAKIKEYHQKALDEAGPAEIAAMVQSIHKADPLKLPTGAEKKKEEKKKTVSPRDNIENEPPGEKKPELVLSENGDKAQRIKDEKALKLVKWNFQAPTDEHIAQLQNLLGAQAKVSLMSQLFNKDFKQQLKGIEQLAELAEIAPGTITANSDLLLKWCTLRFFETNPSVLIKVLELCKIIVVLIRDTETTMSVEELTAFVPYLLIKTGEAKENMRVAVREIVDILTDIVGPLKMAPMILEALKGKNARQRAECLLVIESYVSNAGIATLKALGIEKTAAGLVADKDVNVRNAAINVLVACYKFEGDQMWKAAGRIPDKDRSMVEERIKRSGVVAGSGVAKSTPTGGPKIVVPQQGTVVRRPHSQTRNESNEAEEKLNDTFTMHSGTPRRPMEETRSTSRYALRDDFVSSAFSRLTTIQAPIISPVQSYQQPIKRTNSSSSISSIDTGDQIERSINNISSSLPDVAEDAMYQVTYVLNQPDQRHLVDRRADLVFRACSAQLDSIMEDFNAGKGLPTTMDACIQMLFMLVGGVDQDHGLEPLAASPESIKSMIVSILRCINSIGNAEGAYERARSLNRLAMRLIYRMELSNLLCGLVLAITECLKKYPDVAKLVSRLTSKWCQELEKRRTQLRSSAIVSCFNNFYQLALVELKLDLADEYIDLMDNILERVILQQGDVVLDAARRLDRPHMHLTSLINKLLQTMREKNIAPIMPGTLEEPVATAKEDVVTRKGPQVLFENIVRDSSRLVEHTTKLVDALAVSTETRHQFDEFKRKSPFGEMLDDVVKLAKSGELVNPNLVSTVESAQAALRIAKMMGVEEEALMAQIATTPPQSNSGFSKIERGDMTVTRNAAPAIKPPKRKTMSREQMANIQKQLQSATIN
ncbi:unnamed protein product [Caenorhabditis bovis]|uniref:TOG domain-containing protein n=1 Tax=Caenorhabditis bovis TaxID=2654633 RepID=A0A8S1ENM6_9PELO|nr:unnamed protein product [Caenorhabditis bovis]